MAATRLCNIMQQLSVSCSTGTERLVSRLEKKKKKKLHTIVVMFLDHSLHNPSSHAIE